MAAQAFNPGFDMPFATFGEILLERSTDDHPGLLFEDSQWSWRDFVAEAAARAPVFLEWQERLSGRIDERPEAYRQLHVGILLENVPEYLFCVCAAALSGVTVIGVNPTRRGVELAADIRGVDCDIIITDHLGRETLAGLDTGVDEDAVVDIDSDEWRTAVAENFGSGPELTEGARTPDALLALLFTSGSTGAPKAVTCSTGRLAMLGTVNFRGLVRDDVAYSAMPLFHGNALMAAFAPAAFVGATFAMRRRFSASGFLPDVLKFGATYVNYVGRSLSYILAQQEHPDEERTRLRIVFGTEASVHDREEFERRFGVQPGEAYGSSEGAVVIQRTADTPPSALGISGAHMSIAVLDADGNECPPADFDEQGKLLNASEAIGEICNLHGGAMFEGYYRNPDATAERIRGDVYHSGDLGYRDSDGFFYFAGRSGDRIRVDSENFSAGPVERILDRFPGVLVVAVYPVPDPSTGDRVMAAIQLEPDARFDPNAFAEFCRTQPDMGTKWAPSFVRILDTMPVTATRKISKPELRRASWVGTTGDDPGDLYLRTEAGGYHPMTDGDRAELLAEYELHGRSPLGV